METEIKNMREEDKTEVESFKKQLFYWFGISGSLASIIGLVYVMVSNPNWQNLYITLTSCLYIIALVITVIYHIRERKILLQEKSKAQLEMQEAIANMERARLEAKQAETFAEALAKAFPALHSIGHAFRHECERLKKCPITSIDDLKDSKFLLSVCDNLKMIYERITDKTCAVCIKLHMPKQKILVPIARDAASFAQRGLFDNWELGGYGETSIESNTASQRIINNGGNFFVADDLISMQDKEGYDNNRKDWFQYYRSALVMPIRFYNEVTREKHIPALLSIDSKATNIFDNSVCIEIGAAVTDMLYVFFTHPNFTIDALPPKVKKLPLNLQKTGNNTNPHQETAAAEVSKVL
jgi:hypothetical protein